MEVLFLQYNTLLLNVENSFAEKISFRLFDKFIVPLFEGKTFDQYLIILVVRSLANVILKNYGLRYFSESKNCYRKKQTPESKMKAVKKSFGRPCVISKRTDPESS